MVLRALVLTDDLYRDSVTCIDMVRMRASETSTFCQLEPRARGQPECLSESQSSESSWPYGDKDTGLNNVYKSSVKTKERKTNKQASFSSSLLQNNMEVEEAIELALHLDETGLHRVSTGFDKTWSGLVGSSSYHSNRPVLVCTNFAPSSCQV